MGANTEELKISQIIYGGDTGAFCIMARVNTAMRRKGLTKVDCDLYFEEATGGDYDNLIAVSIKFLTQAGYE